MVAVLEHQLLGRVQLVVLLHKVQARLTQGGLLGFGLLALAGDRHLTGRPLAVVGDGRDGSRAHAAGRHLAVTVYGGDAGVAAHPDDEIIIALPAGVQIRLGARVVCGDLQLHLGHFQCKLGGAGLCTGCGVGCQGGRGQHRPQHHCAERPPRVGNRKLHRVERPSFLAAFIGSRNSVRFAA